MSYLDEGFNEFMEKEMSELFSDSDMNTQSPLDFDSFVSDSSISTAKVKEISANRIITGTLAAETTISVGDQNIKIDGINRRIIINDGSNDRVLLGFLKDGF